MRQRGLVERVCLYNKAISDPNRMKMVKIVGSHEPYTLNVSDISQILKISQPAATKHLKVMEEVGFMNRERRGSNVYYSINQQGIQAYREAMDFAFAHCATPCPNNFDCSSCTHELTCV